MNILKKTALGISATLLFILLFVFGLTFGLYRIFSGPDTIKTALKDSGVYQSLVENALDQTQKEEGGDSKEEIPVNQPEVKKVIKDAVSPEFLQAQTEQALDSVYAWAQGKTPKLTFTIRVTEVKQNLANGLGQYAEQRVASLPACPPDAPQSPDFDAFNATCLPAGVAPGQVAAEAKDQVLQADFLKEDTITADSIKGKDGKTLEQQLHALPEAYKRATWAVYGTGLLAVLFAAAVVLCSANWRSGLKKVSIIFIVVGSISALLSGLASFGINLAVEAAKDPMQQSGVKIAQALANDLRGWWMWYGIVLIIVGTITLIILRVRRRGSEAITKNSPSPTNQAESAALPNESSKTESISKSKPKPVKKLVQ